MFALAIAALSLWLPIPAVHAEDPPRPWTFLWYAAVDNNCDGPVQELLGSARNALDDDPGLELLLLVDRHAQYSDEAVLLGEDFTGTRLYRIRRDSAERLDGGDFLPGITKTADVELDTADPVNLRRFLAWGKARFPARHYGLVIYGHANGESMCPDEESGHRMGIADLTRVAGAELSVDFLALELCAMAGIEIAYQWRPGNGGFGADVLLAVPNSGPSLDWDRVFARIRSSGHASPAQEPVLDPARMSALELGRLAIEKFHRGRIASAARGEGMAHEAAACYDLREAAAVKAAVDALAVALARTESRDVFLEVRGPGPIGSTLDYSNGGATIDLYDLCRRAEEYLGDQVGPEAAAVRRALERFVVASFGMPGYPGFEPGKDGVYIMFPRPSEWREFTWYSPLQAKPAWSGNWAFLRDGATPANGVVENWFELLHAWFDDPEGGPNAYRW